MVEQPIRKWAASLQPVSFQSQKPGLIRALSGTFDSRLCNRICNGLVLLFLLSSPSLAQARKTFITPQISRYGAICRKGGSFTRPRSRSSILDVGNAILLKAPKRVSRETTVANSGKVPE